MIPLLKCERDEIQDHRHMCLSSGLSDIASWAIHIAHCANTMRKQGQRQSTGASNHINSTLSHANAPYNTT